LVASDKVYNYVCHYFVCALSSLLEFEIPLIENTAITNTINRKTTQSRTFYLGTSYSDIRYAKKLDRMGFIWNIADQSFEDLFYILTIFKSMYGHLNVPARFKILDSNQFQRCITNRGDNFTVSYATFSLPSKYHGYRLGSKVQFLRSKGQTTLAPDQLARLTEIEFSWNVKNKIIEAR